VSEDLDAVRGGPMCESHFGQSGPMTEAILLGTVAVRLPETTLEWQAGPMKFRNNTDADKLLQRRYRAGWNCADF